MYLPRFILGLLTAIGVKDEMLGDAQLGNIRPILVLISGPDFLLLSFHRR